MTEDDSIRLITNVSMTYEPTEEYGHTIGTLLRYAVEVGSLQEILLTLYLLSRSDNFSSIEQSEIRSGIISFINVQFADTLIDDFFGFFLLTLILISKIWMMNNHLLCD